MKKKNSIILITLVIAILLDQASKRIIVSNFDYATSTTIIRNFFRITYVQNTGAAFSILTSSRAFLIIIIMIFIIGLTYYILKIKNKTTMDLILYGTLLGGIIGNLIDRIYLGYVIDFLDFNIGKYNYPVFNIADIFIVVSAIILVIKEMRK
jgi:signal peptidase II